MRISVCGAQDTQNKTRQGAETTQTRGLYLGKVPSDLRFEPPCPRYGQITVLAHMSPKRGLGWAKWPQKAYGTPCVVSPIVQNVTLACHLSLDMDLTRWVESTGGFGTVLDRFGPILACFGPLSVSIQGQWGHSEQ